MTDQAATDQAATDQTGPRLVVLLRGINLGAHRRVPMARLRTALEDAGYPWVRTLLQSGNVVLNSDDHPGDVQAGLPGTLRAAFDMDIDVVVRTRDELAGVLARNPFAGQADDPRLEQVSFLSGEPDPDGVRRLVAATVAPERVEVCGREVHAWHPGGIARSPLAALITERTLGVTVTARNRRTLTALLALADDPA